MLTLGPKSLEHLLAPRTIIFEFLKSLASRPSPLCHHLCINEALDDQWWQPQWPGFESHPNIRYGPCRLESSRKISRCSLSRCRLSCTLLLWREKATCLPWSFVSLGQLQWYYRLSPRPPHQELAGLMGLGRCPEWPLARSLASLAWGSTVSLASHFHLGSPTLRCRPNRLLPLLVLLVLRHHPRASDLRCHSHPFQNRSKGEDALTSRWKQTYKIAFMGFDNDMSISSNHSPEVQWIAQVSMGEC